jgi:hypothetical protein
VEYPPPPSAAYPAVGGSAPAYPPPPSAAYPGAGGSAPAYPAPPDPKAGYPGPGYGAPGYGAPGYGMPGYGGPGYGTGEGAPPYGPPAYGPPGYGPPGYGAPGYGVQGYPAPAGYPPAGYAPPGYWPPQPYWGFGFGGPPRPSGATVITGAVVQIVQAAFALLIGLAFLAVGRPVDNSVAESDVGLAPADEFDVTAASVTVGLVIVSVAVFLIVLAALAIRRKRWAAITSIALQAVAIVLQFIAIIADRGTSGAEAIPLLLGATIMILLVVPASTRYLESP